MNTAQNNQKLEDACFEGNLETVIALTINPNLKVDIDCGQNYPLLAACIQGHLDIVKFLLNHPEQEKRELVNKQDVIIDAIDASIEKNQLEVVLFFKENYKAEFTHYMSPNNQEKINNNFNILSINGSLDMIKFIMKEKSHDIPVLSLPLMLEETIKNNHTEVFEYWLGFMDGKQLTMKASEDVVHMALYSKKFKELDQMIKKFDFNLVEILKPYSFLRIMENSPESLNYIFHEHNYMPSSLMKTQISNYFNKMSPDAPYYNNWKNFITLIQIKEEKDSLAAHIIQPTDTKITKPSKI